MINLTKPSSKTSPGRYLCITISDNGPEFATCNIAGKDLKPFVGCLPEGFEDTAFLVDYSTLRAIRENGGIFHVTPGGNAETVDHRQFYTDPNLSDSEPDTPEYIIGLALAGRYDEPGNKVIADANYDEETGHVEVRWQCDKEHCNCEGHWTENW